MKLTLYFLNQIRAFVTSGGQVENNQTTSVGPTRTGSGSAASSSSSSNGALEVATILDGMWALSLLIVVATIIS